MHKGKHLLTAGTWKLKLLLNMNYMVTMHVHTQRDLQGVGGPVRDQESVKDRLLVLCGECLSLEGFLTGDFLSGDLLLVSCTAS